MKHDEREQRRQTKLLQNNGVESLKGVQGYSMIVAWRGVAWRGVVQCGVALCGTRRGRVRRCMGERDGKMEGKLRWRMCAACVVVSGGKGVCWQHVLAAGSLEALSNVVVVGWRRCGLTWTWTAVVAARARARG